MDFDNFYFLPTIFGLKYPHFLFLDGNKIKKKVSKKVVFSLMARPLPPAPPLNGLAISGGTFFLWLP